jgi:U11/U12 small nuclear ribonucleoprotein SNRNP65
MSLPCPFDENPFTSTAPFEIIFKESSALLRNEDRLDLSEPMAIESSSSESEIESDENENKKEKVKQRDESIVESKTKKLKVKEFLKPDAKRPGGSEVPLTRVFEKFKRINPDEKIKINVSKELKADEKMQEKTEIEQLEDGFGRLEAVPGVAVEHEGTSVQKEPSEFISLEELRKNRLKYHELKELNVYKNYERGEPNTRLYVKNLNKKIEDTHLRHIYGRFVEWQNEAHAKLFEIRLMKEGRMKGQAFVTLPSEELALKALEETLGYVLMEKPIIVQFARSTKQPK